LNQKFSTYEYENLDQLLSLAERLPVAEAVPLTRLAGARRWSNSCDYRAIYTAEHIWQVSGKNYTVVQHAALIKAVVSQLAELGFDASHGRVDTWNEEGRIWITALSPSEFEPISGDPYRDGVLFANSYDGSTAVSASYYAWRKVCENGLHAWTKEMAARKIHVGSSSIRNWVRLAIRRIREQRPEFEQLIQRAAQERFDEDVNTVLKRFEIGPKVADKLVAKLERTTDLTRYDLANALTNYATHELRTRPLAREKYEDVARRIMVVPTKTNIR
jgi:transposase-like protein